MLKRGVLVCIAFVFILCRLSIGKKTEAVVKPPEHFKEIVFPDCLKSSGKTEPPKFKFHRLNTNPIIRPDMLQGNDGENINGPSLIEVPSWVKNPLGKYYLYFAHHSGDYIRMAYSDHLEGPWQVYSATPVWSLKRTPHCKKNGVDGEFRGGHVASPDVVILPELQRLRMYYHCSIDPNHHPGVIWDPVNATHQISFIAESRDGLWFQPLGRSINENYLRVFRWNHEWYAVSKHAVVTHSKDGIHFDGKKKNLVHMNESDGYGIHPRHSAVYVKDNLLWVYYTNIGAAPESIHRTLVVMKGDHMEWNVCLHQEVLRPEMTYEGAAFPVVKSSAGGSYGHMENALRDPYVFVGNTTQSAHLLYTVGGEHGIAIGQIIE